MDNESSMSYHNEDFIAGQPSGEKMEDKKEAKDMFKLGKTVAALEQQKKENEQAAQMTQVQMMLLQQKEQALSSREMELQKMMSQLQSSMSNPMVSSTLPNSPLPVPQEGGGGAALPIPQESGGMPPEMGGQPQPNMGMM